MEGRNQSTGIAIGEEEVLQLLENCVPHPLTHLGGGSVQRRSFGRWNSDGTEGGKEGRKEEALAWLGLAAGLFFFLPKLTMS